MNGAANIVMAKHIPKGMSAARAAWGGRAWRHSFFSRMGGLLGASISLLLWSSKCATAEFAFSLCDPFTEYLDTSVMSCVACADNADGTGNNLNKVPDIDHIDEWGNPLRCRCAEGYRQVTQSCSDAALLAGTCVGFTCTSCATTGYAAYEDGSGCVRCDTSTSGFDSTTMDCTCAAASDGYNYEALSDMTTAGGYATNKSCVACPTGSFVHIGAAQTYAGHTYEEDRYTCQSCPDENMAFSGGQCACVSGYTLTGQTAIGPQMCIKTAQASTLKTGYPEVTAQVVRYYALQSSPSGSAKGTYSVNSLVLSHYYLWAATECYHYRGPDATPACHTLANLCVLQHYDITTEACKVYRLIRAARSSFVHQQAGWSATLPWLYYDTLASSVTKDLGISMRVSFKAATNVLGSTYDTMVFKLAKFSLNGTWLGMEDLSTQLLYCNMSAPFTDKGGGSSRSTRWLRFGYNSDVKYDCDFSQLLYHETFFYDLYLVDQATDALYPVPVRNVNYGNAQISPNANRRESDESDDLYTRRFFLFDTVSGITTDSVTGGGGKRLPVVFRYASSIILRTSVQTSDPSKLFPPILIINYQERLTSSFLTDESTAASTGTVSTTGGSSSSSGSSSKSKSKKKKTTLQYDTLTFTAEYTMSTDEFWSAVRSCFGGGCVVVFLIFVVRMRNWQLRNTRLLSVVAQYSQTIASVNWKALIELCILFLHSIVLVFMPFVFLICASWFVFFKLQSTVYLLLPPNDPMYGSKSQYYPLSVILSLLWLFQLLYVLHMIYVQTQADLFFVDWERPRSSERGGEEGTVSVWRTIFVANEWAELQVYRKSSIACSLLFISFFLISLNLQYNATPQPDITDVSPGTLNPALRFANTTFWWVLLSSVQLLWKWAIYERYLSEPREQFFVDMCTIAKVSIVVLDERYHGYYLHCRSPYPFADGSMMDILEQLKKEESGLTTDRGLEGGPKDVQVFELFLTERWRQKYDKSYSKLYQNRTDTPMINQRLGEFRRNAFNNRHFKLLRKSEAPPEDVMQAMEQLSSFVQDFVDQNFSSKDLKRVIREPSTLDKYLRIPPDMKLGGTGNVLYPSRSYGFTRTMFLGNEWDLILLNILTYSVCDLWWGSSALSLLLTYLLDTFLVLLRRYFGERNMALKTMVDERFLA